MRKCDGQTDKQIYRHFDISTFRYKALAQRADAFKIILAMLYSIYISVYLTCLLYTLITGFRDHVTIFSLSWTIPPLYVENFPSVIALNQELHVWTDLELTANLGSIEKMQEPFLSTEFLVGGIFKASALWADAFYKSKCPSVCPSVRLCVCLCVHFWGTV